MAVSKLIKSFSKNSEYFKTEQQRIEIVKKKVQKYRAKVEK
jgi:hypothetical protein